MPDVYVAPKEDQPNPKTEAMENRIVDEKKSGKKFFADEMDASKKWWQEVVGEVLERMGEYPRKAMWGAYCIRPGHRFVTQQDDEEIVLLLRAHPFTNIGWVLVTLGMVILPIFLLTAGIFTAVPIKFLFIGRMVWYLMTLMYAFEKFLYWYYSVFIVSNERLVDIDFENLMFRVVTFANLNHIEEPVSVTGGFIRSLFQYGNVWVTTASETPTVEAMSVPYPDKVVDLISRLSEELEKRRERGE